MRNERGMTQAALAKEIGITQPSLSEIETGASKSVDGVTLVRLCQVLRVRAAWLMLGEGERDDPSEVCCANCARGDPKRVRAAMSQLGIEWVAEVNYAGPDRRKRAHKNAKRRRSGD